LAAGVGLHDNGRVADDWLKRCTKESSVESACLPKLHSQTQYATYLSFSTWCSSEPHRPGTSRSLQEWPA